MTRHKRRSFTVQQKADAVRWVLEEGRSVRDVAQDLGVGRAELQSWVEEEGERQGGDEGREFSHREQKQDLRRLRRQNQRNRTDGEYAGRDEFDD